MKIISSLLLALCVCAAVISAARPLENLVGGYTPVSTSDPEVQAAASFAWQAVAAKDNRVNLDTATDLAVVTAAKQVVNGVNFKLTMKGDFDGSEIDVHAVVYRDLQNNMALSTYRVTVVSSKKMTVGGYQPVSTSDPDVQAAASFTWEQVAAEDKRVNLDEGTDLEIVSAFQQVVAGKNFKLELSGSFSGDQITVHAVVYQKLSGDLSLTSYKVSSANFKAADDVGGYSPVDKSDPEVQAAASFAWQQVSVEDSRVNLDEGTNLLIESAEEQIVAGKNFHLVLSGTFSGSKLTIDAIVFQSLAGDLALTDYSLTSASASFKAADVGGYSPVDKSDPEVKAAAGFTWGQVAAQDSRVNLDEGTNLLIESAEEQIVAGKNFHLVLSGTFSGSKLTIDAVVYQSLEGDLSLTSFSVSSASVGGYSPVDKSAGDVLDVAKWLWEDLAKIADSGIDLSIGTNLEIVSAEKQVVAGTNYKLKVTGTFGSDQILVNAVIYKDLQGNYSLTSYETHVANGVIM